MIISRFQHQDSSRRWRPLAENTLRRIANGVRRYVIDAAEPFIVTCNHGGSEFRGQSLRDPLYTVTASRDATGLVAPYFVPRHGERPGQEPRCREVDRPHPTVTPTANGASLVSAFLAKHYTGVVGEDLRWPVPTITATDHNALTAAHLVKLRGTCRDGQDLRGPMPTVTAGGFHVAEVRAFLLKYYGTATGQSLTDPARPKLTCWPSIRARQ